MGFWDDYREILSTARETYFARMPPFADSLIHLAYRLLFEGYTDSIRRAEKLAIATEMDRLRTSHLQMKFDGFL